MKKTYVILVSILFLGTVLRLYHNTDIALWHDEAFSALLIKYSWSEMMYRIGLDVHPPIYYIALRGWSEVLGTSLLALRGFSIFFGVLTAWAGFLFVKQAFKSEKAALIAALLIAINPFQLQYALEARMYTFGTFFGVLAGYFYARGAELLKAHYTASMGGITIAPAKRLKAKIALYYILFGLSLGIIALTHYYLLFIAAAIAFYALLHHIYHYRTDITAYAWLFGSYAVVGLCFAPWIKQFLFQYRQVGAGYWIPPMDEWSIPTTVWQMLIGLERDIHQGSTQLLVIAASLFTLLFLVQFLKKITQPEKWLVILALAAPFAGAVLFFVLAKLNGSGSSVYLVRYFLFASSFYLIALAVWLSSLRIRQIGYILLIIYAATNLGVFARYWKNLDVTAKPGMAAAAKLLESNVSASDGDKIFVGSSFEFFNLKYYVNRETQVPDDIISRYGAKYADYQLAQMPRPLLYSGGNTSVHNLPHYAGTAILTDQDLLPRFEDSAKPGEIVWLLWTNGFGGTKPEVPNTWEQLAEWGYADVHPYVGTWIIVTKYKVH